MGHPWRGQQKALLRQYQAMGAEWVTAEVNKVPGAPLRTEAAVRRHACTLGLSREKCEPIETTPGIDAAIRRAYASGKSGAARRCAEACNRPRWWIVVRAKALECRALKSQNSRPWTDRERGTVRAAAHLPLGEIQARLKASGSRRTLGAIKMLKARENIEALRDQPLSGTRAAFLLGIDVSSLTRLISAGRLIAGRARGDGVGKCQQYLIEPVEIARFAIKHPQMVDLRKVDPIWFIDLIAHHSADAMRDMHRTQSVRIAQMVREAPDIVPERLADIFGVSDAEGRTLLTDARRELRREAA